MKISLLLTTVLSVAAAGTVHAQVTSEINALRFAQNNKLNETQLIDYLLCREGVGYNKLIDARTGRFSEALKSEAVKDQLGPVKTRLTAKSGPPWDAKAVENAYAKVKSETQKEEGPFGIEVPGLTVPKVRELPGGRRLEMSGLRLRKDVEQFGVAREDAKGATLTWSDNRLVEGHGAWNSEGALGYPLRLHDGAAGWDLSATPAVSWKLLQEDGATGADVRDLEFSLPFTALTQLESRGHVALVGRPYYHTDFDLKGGIAGATLTLDWAKDIGLPFGMYKTVPGFEKLAWQWTFNPQLDWNEVLHESPWIERKKDDDWLRAGAVAGVSIRPWGKSKLELSANYRFLCGLSGDPDYSDMLSLKATTWFSDEVGLSFEYQRGNTPVSDKDVDLLTLGLEIRL